ncbi:hypothetical protein QA601_14190 [Chitinispirillales bacterium ANBcel5]|uniref:hypothetical protein n=1 Tax=Cellulosispirillum alkaliphilum TaxID=3039283 RepID=UPI002A5568D5|nr:hypothetical protein [Chitinispirillales bacterium ANBcel5]
MVKFSECRAAATGVQSAVIMPSVRPLRLWSENSNQAALSTRAGYLKFPSHFTVKGSFVGRGSERRIVVAGKIGKF